MPKTQWQSTVNWSVFAFQKYCRAAWEGLGRLWCKGLFWIGWLNVIWYISIYKALFGEASLSNWTCDNLSSLPVLNILWSNILFCPKKIEENKPVSGVQYEYVPTSCMSCPMLCSVVWAAFSCIDTIYRIDPVLGWVKNIARDEFRTTKQHCYHNFDLSNQLISWSESGSGPGRSKWSGWSNQSWSMSWSGPWWSGSRIAI